MRAPALGPGRASRASAQHVSLSETMRREHSSLATNIAMSLQTLHTRSRVWVSSWNNIIPSAVS